MTSVAVPTAVHVAAAKAICRSGKFETGQGTCAMLCMEFLGDPRKNGCSHALKIHGKLALAVLECARPMTINAFLAGYEAGERGDGLDYSLDNFDTAQPKEINP